MKEKFKIIYFPHILHWVYQHIVFLCGFDPPIQILLMATISSYYLSYSC